MATNKMTRNDALNILVSAYIENGGNDPEVLSLADSIQKTVTAYRSAEKVETAEHRENGILIDAKVVPFAESRPVPFTATDLAAAIGLYTNSGKPNGQKAAGLLRRAAAEGLVSVNPYSKGERGTKATYAFADFDWTPYKPVAFC